jgi:hypothetical protein
MMSIRHDLKEMYVAAYRAGGAAGSVAIFTDDAEVHSPMGRRHAGERRQEALHGAWVQETPSGH